MSTVFALASARGKAGVAVVRISGPDAFSVAERLCGELPEVRGLRRLRHEGDLLDEALVLVFQRGASFTGEPVVEFHTHGSVAVIDAVLRALGEDERAQPAEAGEFTRRALLNGRLDLAQVEALADLVEAETEAQRRQALRGLSGGLGERAESWRRRLIRAAALLEATIDFADEEVPVDVTPEVLQLLQEVRSELSAEAQGVRAAERVRQGFEVAILGAPNLGKSTLLNRLAGREAAITSEFAGTTRDVIEVRMELGGLPVTLLDTAGLREAADPVEGIGIARAKTRAAQADLRVVLVDDPEAVPEFPLEDEDIVIRAKADLHGGGGVSGLTGEGVDGLVARVARILERRASGIGAATRERHRAAILRAQGALSAAAEAVERGPEAVELASEELRAAVRALDSLVGRVDVEHILGEIFASFCIGK